LAAVIINPRRYSPLQPSPRIEHRVRIIASRLHARGALDDDQYQLALGQAPPAHEPSWLERLFGGGGASGGQLDTVPADSVSSDSSAGPEL